MFLSRIAFRVSCGAIIDNVIVEKFYPVNKLELIVTHLMTPQACDTK